MYIVKNFLSDMAYSTSGGERAEKIMMFQQKKFFCSKVRFFRNGHYKGRKGMLREAKFEPLPVIEIFRNFYQMFSKAIPKDVFFILSITSS